MKKKKQQKKKKQIDLNVKNKNKQEGKTLREFLISSSLFCCLNSIPGYGKTDERFVSSRTFILSVDWKRGQFVSNNADGRRGDVNFL